MKMDFGATLSGAAASAENGKIVDWVHSFLRGEGDNVPFSDGLRLERRWFAGPIYLPIYFLDRCCGPEEHMPYRVERHTFYKKVHGISARLKNGWDMPPLIVNCAQNRFVVNDGNHRLEALRQMGAKTCPVILWGTVAADHM